MNKTQNGALHARFIASARAAAGFTVLVALVGCNSAPLRRAPIEDRSVAPRSSAPSPAPAVSSSPAPSAIDPKTLPGAENAGKPGYYTVKPGDTLIRIGLETGQNWKDLLKWNNFDNPNLIEVGQVLRVVPPGSDPTAVATRGVSASRVESRPLDSARSSPSPSVPPPSAPAPAPVAVAPAATPAPAPLSAPAAVSPAASPVAQAPVTLPSSPSSVREDDGVNWMWPATGPVVSMFDESRSKGLTIAGKAGDPVVAAADGRVVYAGSGLRGYGNLVILKHNNTYLTAYAHNQSLLVKEDQAVKRGQKIAEMGSSDAERVQLHFEIRRQGKPIDPSKMLPAR